MWNPTGLKWNTECRVFTQMFLSFPVQCEDRKALPAQANCLNFLTTRRGISTWQLSLQILYNLIAHISPNRCVLFHIIINSWVFRLPN